VIGSSSGADVGGRRRRASGVDPAAILKPDGGMVHVRVRAMAVRRLVASLVVLAVAGLAYLGGRLTTHDTAMVERTIAMSWGDGKYGPAFYGAWVYVEPANGAYAVHARVWLGAGNDAWHECGELGRAATHEEAVRRWGRVAWTSDGLSIGHGAPDDFFLARDVLEAHR
jgi:hypothetical protein